MKNDAKKRTAGDGHGDTRYGELVDSATVRFERLLPGPIERVWTYITDADRRAQWLCGGVYELEAGGNVEMVFHNSRLSSADDEPPPPQYRDDAGPIAMRGTVLRCQPPNLLEHTWIFGDENSIVRYELAPAGENVRLVLTHTRLPSADTVLSVSGGWHTHLAMLEALLADRPRPRFWATFTPLPNEYAKRFRMP